MILGSDGFAYKLFPQRIEEFFETQENVESCGVVVREDKERLHVAHAFITLKSNVQDKDSCIQYLEKCVQEKLPEHLRPDTIQMLDTMPVTPSGKIDYRALDEIA